MPLTPRGLVRLFPRTWRARYGAEFEALLESSTLTRRNVTDVLRRAAAEWLANTVIGRLILGTGLAAIGTALAAGLAMISPRELQDQNWLIVTPIAFGLTEVAMGCRFLWCALTRTRTLAPEQTAWIAAVFLTSIAAKWGARVMFPGVESLSIDTATWGILIQNCMVTLAMSRILPRGRAVVQLRQRASARPLGLV